MPPPVFFQQLGLFVNPNFLDSEYTSQLCREIATAPSEKASIADASQQGKVDLKARSVGFCLPPERSRAPLNQRLLEIRPALERHFGMHLAEYEPPEYLMYRPGDFFKAHRDSGEYGTKDVICRRRVSVVIFLNRQSQEPSQDGYGDGDLMFYGLLDGPQWGKCAFPLKAEPGLLIAFPSDKLHEVKPVSHGRRFTVVTWFLAPQTES